MRARFTIPDEKWVRALQYAKDTNRTPSELVCEALDQIQARYPKRPRIDAEAENRIAARILSKIAPHVPAGTIEGNGVAI